MSHRRVTSWPLEPALKAGVPTGTESDPPPSAIVIHNSGLRVPERELQFMAIAMGLASGPHALTDAGVDAAVELILPGAYVLGKMGLDGVFYIDYVGRSDDDVAGRLKQHTPERYPQFFYGYYPTAKAAYEKECWLYHTFKPQDNKVHPAKPKNSWLSCPECGYSG